MPPHIENETVEFKQELSDGVVKTVIAFANSSGGILYIGVDDVGEVVGLPDVDATATKLSNMLRDSIKPDVLMFTTISIKEYLGKSYIEVLINRGSKRPYYLASKGPRPEGVYLRIGAANIPASDNIILTMIKETSHDSYEVHPSPIQALTFTYIKERLAENNFEVNEGYLRTLGALLPDGTYTNFGLLISDQCPCTIKAATFADDERTVFTSRVSFEGSVLKQLDEVYEYTVEHTPYLTTMEGLKHHNQYNIPLIALRETLINAVAHREYAISAPTLISIMPTGTQIVTIGGLPSGINKTDLDSNISVPRNNHLVSLLYRLSMIEAFGTGISRIKKSYEDSLVTPYFLITDNSFSVFLPNQNINIDQFDSVEPRVNEKELNDIEHTMTKQSVKRIYDEDQVLDFLSQGTRTRPEIEKYIQRSQTYTNKLLRKLIDDGQVRKLGQGRNTYYELL